MGAQLVSIPADDVRIEGLLEIPSEARGVVLFAHGNGSSWHSPRSHGVAAVLRQHGIGTLQLDLLTLAEDLDYLTRFDISLLTHRLLVATGWVRIHTPPSRTLPIGYFGAGTGAAAALQAAAELQKNIRAVVSNGGRPDLAGAHYLDTVQSPTLLLVGSQDQDMLDLNRKAYAQLSCTKALRISPAVTEPLEEHGTLAEVASQAAHWYRLYLKH